jgi:hypothetical protein
MSNGHRSASLSFLETIARNGRKVAVIEREMVLSRRNAGTMQKRRPQVNTVLRARKIRRMPWPESAF